MSESKQFILKEEAEPAIEKFSIPEDGILLFETLDFVDKFFLEFE